MINSLPAAIKYVGDNNLSLILGYVSPLESKTGESLSRIECSGIYVVYVMLKTRLARAKAETLFHGPIPKGVFSVLPERVFEPEVFVISTSIFTSEGKGKNSAPLV